MNGLVLVVGSCQGYIFDTIDHNIFRTDVS